MSKRSIFICLAILVLAVCVPLVYGQDTNQIASSRSPLGGLWVLVAIIAYVTRKRPIGGWLMFFFITLYLSLIMVIVSLFALGDLSKFSPLFWDDKFIYFLFMLTEVPDYLILLVQLFLSFFLIRRKFRDWKYVIYLKYTLLSGFAFGLLSFLIELKYWPEYAPVSFIFSVPSLIWFFYFHKSSRVYYVYKMNQWDWNSFKQAGGFYKESE